MESEKPGHLVVDVFFESTSEGTEAALRRHLVNAAKGFPKYTRDAVVAVIVHDGETSSSPVYYGNPTPEIQAAINDTVEKE